MARASIKQVAQIAGVSTMTVSRVLRGQGGSQFEEQVRKAARELDYVPVRSAIQNRHVKTGVIGVLLDDDFSIDSSIGRQTFDGLRRAAFDESYDLLILHPQHHQSLDKQKASFLDRRCDGFIFVVPFENPKILELLVEHEFPAVTCYSTDVPNGLAYVVPDNRSAVQQGIQILREQGHRKIAFCGASRGHSDARERLDTFEQEMKACGLAGVTFELSTHDLEDQQKAGEVLTSLLRADVTAVMCHNDERAVALWDVASKRGLRIPQDLSLVGIDDIAEAAQRGLTTFSNPFFDIGWTAAKSLFDLLQGGTVRAACRKLPMPLMERDSIASGPQHNRTFISG